MRHGFLLIDKPEGPTSHDIVGRARQLLGEQKIGHLGTLDPAASGLLVLAVGAKALKVVELFTDLDKEYEATIMLGAVSTTYDREGMIEDMPAKLGWMPPDIHTIQRIIEERFMGVIAQVPPAASAIKVGGERAYRKMRQGRAVDLPPRTVEITDCSILSYTYPHLSLHVTCGSGTYIRSLAHDLGQVLHCGGYLTRLKRTRVGEWQNADATGPEQASWGRVIPLKDSLGLFPGVELSDEELDDVCHGRSINHEVRPETIAWHAGLPIALLVPLRDGTGQARARKVF